MTLKKLIHRSPIVVLALLALALPSAATADPVLIIQVTGLDLAYAGGQLCDAHLGVQDCAGGGGNPATSDSLTTMTFGLDTTGNGVIDNLFGTQLTDIWADVSLTADPLVQGTPFEGNGGLFDFLTEPGTPGWGVALDLDDWTMTLSSDGVFFNGSGFATIFAQDLPIPGIGFDETQDVIFSFSSQVTNLQPGGAGSTVTSFNASGTGEIKGPYVPEPGTLLFLGGSLAGLAFLRRRRQ